MTANVDEIAGNVVLWPLKLMRLDGCRDVASEVDEI